MNTKLSLWSALLSSAWFIGAEVRAEGVAPSRESAPLPDSGTPGAFEGVAVGFPPGGSTPLDLYPTLTEASQDLVDELNRLTKALSPFESQQVERYIQDARDIVSQRRGSSSVLCLPSIQKAGKYCMKSISGDDACIGNYFDGVGACKMSLSVSRDHRACYQSESKPGKALISNIDLTSALIGNYYSTFNACVDSMRYSYGPLVCMESVRHVGKWFIANLDQNAEQVGGYLASFGECARALGFDYQDPVHYLTKASEVDQAYDMFGVATSFNWGGGQEYWIATAKPTAFGTKQLFMLPNGDVYAWDGKDAKGFLANGAAFGSAKVAEVSPEYYKAIYLLIAGIDDPVPPKQTVMTLASEVLSVLQLTGTGTNLNWGGGGDLWIFVKNTTATGQHWVYLLPNGELWVWDAQDQKGFLANGATVRSQLVAKLNPAYYSNIAALVAGGDYAADVDRKYELKGPVVNVNWGGLGEKWFKGKASDLGDWYFILPSGLIYQWSSADTKATFAALKNSRKVGRVDASFFVDPSKLVNAAP